MKTVGLVLLGGAALGAQGMTPIQDSYCAAGESIKLPKFPLGPEFLALSEDAALVPCASGFNPREKRHRS